MKKSPRPLRVVQIGVEHFGRRRRALMRESGLFEWVGVYDWDIQASCTAAAEEGCEIAGSYEELLEMDGVEAVVISTGALYHAEQIELAARKGLHVFVEKPVCATQEEVQSLLNVERETRVVIAVGHTAHDQENTSLSIRRLIDSGELGTVATFQKTTAHSGGLRISPGDWRGNREKNPGGMLFQCGVHGLHELMFYFGPIVQVFASMNYSVHTTATADVAICQLFFESGLVGTLSAYHVTPYRHSLHIFGTRANLYREERFFDEGSTLSIQRGRSDGGKEEVELLPVVAGGARLGNLRNFFSAIRDQSPVYPSLHDGLRAVQVVLAAEESARLGLPIPVAPLVASEALSSKPSCAVDYV